MKAHLIDTHLLVPRSRSSAKVKYQGHISKKENGCFEGISFSQKYLVLFLHSPFYPPISLVQQCLTLSRTSPGI